MILVVIAVAVCLSTSAPQSRPDFSGAWSKVRASAEEPVEMMTVSQNGDTLIVERTVPSSKIVRLFYKLNGSENRNAYVQGHPPREVVELSTVSWRDNSLVFTSSGRSNEDGAVVIRATWSLDGGTLVIHTVETSQTYLEVLRESAVRYSKVRQG